MTVAAIAIIRETVQKLRGYIQLNSRLEVFISNGRYLDDSCAANEGIYMRADRIALSRKCRNGGIAPYSEAIYLLGQITIGIDLSRPHGHEFSLALVVLLVTP